MKPWTGALISGSILHGQGMAVVQKRAFFFKEEHAMTGHADQPAEDARKGPDGKWTGAAADIFLRKGRI
jgi:hypothetical protein